MKKIHLLSGLGLLALSTAGYFWKTGAFDSKAPAGAGPAAPAAANAASGPRTGGPGGPAGAPATPLGPAGVEVAKVEAVDIVDDAQAVGTLRSLQSIIVRPEVAGRIASLGFKDGQTVAKGQLLVQLDDTLQQAELRAATAQMAIAQSNLSRNKELVAQNFVSQRAVDEAAASLDVSRAQVQLAQARAQRMRVVAPFGGIAGIKSISVGDYVKDGADIVNLEDTSAMNTDFRLPERLIEKIALRQKVELRFDALPGKRYLATIEAIDPLLDANVRSVSVRARVPNPTGELKPGLFARARTIFGERKGALLVPEEALVAQGNKQFVIRVQAAPAGADGKPGVQSQRAEVKLGVRQQGKVEVLEGLSAGDRVITAGQQRAQRDGTALRIVDLSAPRAPAGGASAAAPASPAAAGAASGAAAGASRS